MTDGTALLDALSTIAQCAAALAALIGFLGLWRLDRLREEQRRLEDDVIAVAMRIHIQTQPAPVADILLYHGEAYSLQEAQTLIDDPQGAGDQSRVQMVHMTLKPMYADYMALKGIQLRLLWALRCFLVVTLNCCGLQWKNARLAIMSSPGPTLIDSVAHPRPTFIVPEPRLLILGLQSCLAGSHYP
jgi:hypothetical protein